MSEHTPTPWEYRPDEYDDWGWIRARRIDDIAPLVAIAKGGSWQEAKSLDDHRRDKTDPYEANGRFIVKACNSHDALVKALRDIIEANDDFRQGMPDGWEGDPLQDACEAARRLVGHKQP